MRTWLTALAFVSALTTSRAIVAPSAAAAPAGQPNASATPAASSVPAAATTSKEPELIRFRTADGWVIGALYQAPAKGRPVAVLVHGFAAGKGEWGKLSEALWEKGWGTLALDIRGHGDSTLGPAGRQDWKGIDAFGRWSAAEADIAAAVDFLRLKAVPAWRVSVVGASLGANLAAAYWARKPLRSLAMLSPGADYRGVVLPEALKGRRLAAAAPNDPYAMQTVVGYMARSDGTATLRAEKGHGVQMFDDPVFFKDFVRWLRASPSAAPTPRLPSKKR